MIADFPVRRIVVRSRSFALLIALSCVIATASAAAREAPGASAGKSHVLIRNTTLIDGTGNPPESGIDVLLQGDTISRLGHDLDVPDDAVVIEGQNKYVTPGLIDTHVHLQFPIAFQLTPGQRNAIVNHTPKAFLYNGVTTILNVSAPTDWILEQRDSQRQGRLVGPAIYALGDSFKPEGGWGSRHGGVSRDAADARQMALNHVAAGVDGFKIVIEDGLGHQGTHVEMPDDMLQAIVKVARNHELPMYVHAINLHEYHRAADIEPKAIIHGLEDAIPTGDNLIQKLLANKITVAPTVSLFESFLRPDPRAGVDLDDPVLEGSVPAFLLENMRRQDYMNEERRRFIEASRMDAYRWARSRIPVFRENVTKMHQAGVKIAVGTDGGGTVGYNFQGYNTPWEVKILVECGLSPMEALVAATRTGAEVIGIEDQVGTVEPGKVADLLVLSADPLEDIENIRKIEWVIQKGEPHPRKDFAYRN
jgi:imidazolonepropionase-like amidohydrolase